MKHLQIFLFIGLTIFFFSCNNDNPVTPVNPGSFQGEWTVDKIQMVQAPAGGGASVLMKQALVPFGEVDGSFAGYLDFKFGAETITSANINLGSGESYFIGNTGYYMNSSSLHKSLDGGNSWSEIDFPIYFSTRAMFVKDANTIYVSGYNSGNYMLLKSTNQGTSWTTLNNGMQVVFSVNSINKGFHFINNTTGFALAYSSTFQNVDLYKTTNEGLNWNTIYSFPQSQFVEELDFYSDARALIVYNEVSPSPRRKIFSKTSDGGISWTNNYSPPEFDVYNYFRLNENVFWVFGMNKEGKFCLYKSNDGAQTWNLIIDKILLSQVKFINENVGYGITYDEFVIKTVNGGASWSTYSTPSEFSGLSIKIFNEQPVFYGEEKFWKPSGIIDTTKWTANGMITNSAIQLIAGSYPVELRANGDFQTNSNNIVFTVYNYKNTHNKIGMGTFNFENNYLNVELNLPNDEKWKVKLRRK